MEYSDFSLSQVKKAFGLTERSVQLFATVAAIAPSSWLLETLKYSLKLALSSSSEKARFIYGCVTTGEDCQFLTLEDTQVAIDAQRYYVNELDKILGIFQLIVDKY